MAASLNNDEAAPPLAVATSTSTTVSKRFMEGPLSKWTNVVNGWQYRWFVLDQNAGLLSYYTVSQEQLVPHARERERGGERVVVILLAGGQYW